MFYVVSKADEIHLLLFKTQFSHCLDKLTGVLALPYCFSFGLHLEHCSEALMRINNWALVYFE